MKNEVGKLTFKVDAFKFKTITTTFFQSPVFNWSMADWQNSDLDPEKKLDKNLSFGRQPKFFQSKKK